MWWEALPVLAIALLVITVVGHGIWVLIGLSVRFFFGVFGRTRPSLRTCVSCGRSTSAQGGRCDWCGAILDDPRLAHVTDYSAFVRHLRRLEESGTATTEEVEDLLSRAKAHHQQRLDAARAASTTRPERPAATPAPSKTPSAAEVPLAELVEDPGPSEPKPQIEPRPLGSGPPASGTAGVQPMPPQPEPQPPAVPVAAQPSRSWGQLLEAFMEERNIRWGELIGGLLIVGGGIALAISLREQLQTIPYSQFVVFAVITAAVYGAGLYSHYRWKLATTSRGLLTIALLLTPVSFLIMASLAGGDRRLITLAVEGVGLAVFGYLGYVAARVLVPDRPWSAVVGVLGNSAAVLVLAWLAGRSFEPGGAAGVGLVPAGIFLGAVGDYLVRRAGRRWLDVDRSVAVLTLLGVSAFAWVVAEGHYLAELVKSIGPPAALGELALPLAVVATVPLLAGLVLLRRTVHDETMEVYRTVGTAVGLIGMTVMIVSLGLAWPWPEMLLAVGLFNATVLAIVAMAYRAPVLHAGTIFCTALVVLVGYHAARAGLFGQPTTDQLGRALLQLVSSAPSGNLLGGLFVVSAFVAEALVRAGRRRDGRVYAVGCGVLAAVGLSLVTWHGRFGGDDALRAAILYAVYGLISVGLAARWNQRPLSYFGLALVQASMLWAAWWREEPLWLALLVFASAATLVGVPLRLVMRRRERTLRRHVERLVVGPCVRAGLISLGVALPWLLLAESVSAVELAGHLVWLAALATVLAAMIGRAEWLAAAQVVWVIAAIATIQAWLVQRTDWSWPDLRILQAYGIALASLGVVWNLARLALGRSRPARRLLDPPWPAVDQVVHHGLAMTQWAVLVGCVLPHIARQLGIVEDTGATSFFGLTLDVGPRAWLLVGLLAAAAIARLWHRFENIDLVSLLLIGVTIPCLVAGRFADALAVETAWRWALAVALLIGSVMVWNRDWLARLARRWRVRAFLGTDAVRLARSGLIATTAVPIVGLTALAAVLQISRTPPGGPAPGSFFAEIGPDWSLLAPPVLVVVVLVGYALRERSAVHAFAAGAVVELAVALGYLLQVDGVDVVEFVQLTQLVTIAASVWAVGWLVARRWTDAWVEPAEPRSTVGRALMNVQLVEGVLGNLVLLVPALVVLALDGPRLDTVRKLPMMDFEWWITEVGNLLGWAALILSFGAVAYRQMQT
ncbi:MAG: hypothetical protein JW888_17890, partial [Pirellulales bacterium]|nr:hypothetical protein [Pirellulales bacterium]